MAQLIVAAAGAAIGGATLGTGVVALGMTGTAIGWAAGSMLGSMLFNKSPDGPKIEDGKFSSSIYGQPIPLSYGTIRHSTYVAWWSGLIKRTEEVGGKGGGGAEIERARMNLLLAVCKGPQAGVLRIWANGRLIATFNGRRYELDSDVLPSGDVRVYLGTEDQMPDPTYEEAVGTDYAVPYRGMVMVAIDGLEGEQFGNRPPNIECEVASVVEVEDGCPLEPVTRIEPETALFKGSDYTGKSGTAFDEETGRFFVVGGDTLFVYQSSGGRLTLSHTLGLGIGPVTGLGLNPDTRKLWVLSGMRNGPRIPVAAIIDADSLTAERSWVKLMFYIGGNGGCGPGLLNCCETLLYFWDRGTGQDGNDEGGTGALYGAMLHFDPVSKGAWWSWGNTGLITHSPYLIAPGIGTQKFVEPWPLCRSITTGGEGYVHSGSTSSSAGSQSDVIYIPDGTSGGWIGGLNYRINLNGTLQIVEPNNVTTVGDLWEGFRPASLAWSESRKKLYVLGPGVWVVNLDAETGDPLVATELDVSGSYFDPDAGGSAWSDHHDALVTTRRYINTLTMRVIDPDTDEVLYGPCEYAWNGSQGSVIGLREIGSGWFAGLTNYGSEIVVLKFPGATALGGPTTLQAIVEDVCLRAGLPPEHLDATAGTDIVAGFKVAAQVTARGVLDSLRPVYFFDMPEAGTALVLTKRGGAAIAIIDSGELGASVFELDRSEPEAPYILEHIESQELPRKVDVAYVDFSADYDPGVQSAEIQTGASFAPTQIEAPVVLSAAEAAKVAWVNLLLTHSSVSKISFSLAHKYAGLLPSDAVVIPHASGNEIRVRIESITHARPMLELHGVLEDPSVYEQAARGVQRLQGPAQGAIGTRADTILHLLDLPPLRATDDRLQFYGAVGRATPDGYWPGAAVYRSHDGESYDLSYSTSSEAVIGELVSTLPGWVKGNRWDRESKIRVRLTHGSLSSASELSVLNGANACAVGYEIVQFVDAVLVGDMEWELSTLLRHRVGTEWAATEKGPGTRFILLSEHTLRVAEYPLSDAGVMRKWKAVTLGQAVGDARTLNITGYGNSVRPLAPVHVKGTRNIGGDLTATWVRRARINGDWQDYVDVPLDEATERYMVAVAQNANFELVTRETIVTTPSFAYTAAQQVEDFGTVQGTVYLVIYQLDSEYNALGHITKATL